MSADTIKSFLTAAWQRDGMVKEHMVEMVMDRCPDARRVNALTSWLASRSTVPKFQKLSHCHKRRNLESGDDGVEHATRPISRPT